MYMPILYRPTLSVTAEYNYACHNCTGVSESARLTRTIVGFPDPLIPLIALTYRTRKTS